MAGKLSDRLRAASRRLFVGRQVQRELFQFALTAAELPFSMLHIYGPGGIGKTSLLYEFKHVCETAQIPFTYLDARTIEADPVAFSDALRRLLFIDDTLQPADYLGAQGKHVLFLDTFELLFSLEQWLYLEFFPELSEEALIVIAGRYPPSTVWTDNPGWRSVIKEVPLRNLSPTESRLFLEKMGLPLQVHESAIQYTHGHPLALSLVADALQGANEEEVDLTGEAGLEPDFIKVLLDRFVREAPSLSHRMALEACVLVNHLTESLLAEMIPDADTRVLFEWLRNLSFIESGPRGLFPHDLARDVMGAELRWRNPEQYKMLHQRARKYYNLKLQSAAVNEQSNILKDYIFLHRDSKIVRPFFVELQAEWRGEISPISTDRYRDNDLGDLVEMVAEHEGEEAGKIADMWIQAQPANVIVFRNRAGKAEGFLLMLALHEATPEQLKQDAVANEGKAYLDTHAPLRPGESSTMFRFWMDRQMYQNISQVQSMIFVYMVRHYLTTPQLAFSMLPISNPTFWTSIFTYADLEHLVPLDYTVNGTPYGIFGHDWRQRPPAAWLDVLASRETGEEGVREEVQPRRPVLVLSEEAFAEALKNALRHYTRTDKLAGNPLLDSRIVVEQVSEDADDVERIEVLVQVLNEAVELLENNARSSKAYRAVDRTYLRPAGSQEQAAELLDLPFSTFRRHLTRGVSEITDYLWQRELKA